MIAFAAQVAMNAPEYKKKLDSLVSLLGSLQCRIQGSCAPKLQLAAQQLGLAGYSRQQGKDWWYYLPSGEHLSWADSGVVTWYANSGLRDQIAQIAGACCAKSKYPPREFFPNLGAQVGLVTATLEGVTVQWDKAKWDEKAVREAIRTAKLSATTTGGNSSQLPETGETTSQPAGNDVVTLSKASMFGDNSTLLMLALGFGALLFMRKY